MSANEPPVEDTEVVVLGEDPNGKLQVLQLASGGSILLEADKISVAGEDDVQVAEEQLDTEVAATDVALLMYGDRALQTLAQDEIRTRIFQPDAGGTLQQVIAEELGTAIADTDVGLLTYASRALNSRSLDEFVSRVTDSSGTQIDPLNQDALSSVGDDELRNRILGNDAGGTLQEVNAEQFDTILGTTDVGVATYVARALQDIAQDEIRSRIHDSSGTQIDPATTALEAALKSNDTDEFVTRLAGADGIEVSEEQLDTDIAGTDVGIVTILAKTLSSIAQDEVRVTHPGADVLTDSSTGGGAADAVQLDLGDEITDFDVVFDLSAVNADVVIEVSTDGTFSGEEHEHTRIAQANLSTGANFEQFDTAFQHVRAFYDGADADVTEIEISAKGVS